MGSLHKQKIICLGLGRTGTSSLRDALDMLGFGPCYHMMMIIDDLGGKDLAIWHKFANREGTNEDLDAMLHNYGAILDYPAAIYYAELYAAYPDAKFILTTRDPVKWEKSMRATLLRTPEIIRSLPANERAPEQEALMNWCLTDMQQMYHQGRLFTHAQQEILDHNERVKKLIPPEKLLIYEVGEGWERLVKFLGVPKPTVPFPHVNDTVAYQAEVKDWVPEMPAKDVTSS